jgi:VWFA-related protein
MSKWLGAARAPHRKFELKKGRWFRSGGGPMSVARIGKVLAASILLTGNFIAIFCETPTFKADVRVVNVLAVVREHKGRIVNDLSKEDFILEENEKPQPIKYFYHQADMPLILGLLIDTSISQRRLIEREKQASIQFLDEVLRPERDQVFLARFDYEPSITQDLTNSNEVLKDALNNLRIPPLRVEEGPFRNLELGNGTTLFDSVVLASQKVLRKQEGRKAIILISDGGDNASIHKLEEAIESAQRADTLIYAIRYYDPDAVLKHAGKKSLQALSEQTGGRMFEISKKESLETIFKKIREELRNQYCLGYSLPQTGIPGFRRIRVRTKLPNLEVNARSGYYARN